MDLRFGDGSVLHAPWHDHELPFFQPHIPVSILHAEPTVDDQEQLILAIVLVPDELSLELHELDVLAVQRR